MIRTTEILTPATGSLLTTLDALRVELDLPDNSADAYLTRQIASASAWAANACGRSFGVEIVRDTFHPSDKPRFTPLRLSRTLLQPGAVSAISQGGVALDPVNYSVDPDAGLVLRLTGGGRTMPWFTGAAVVYSAGWTLPGDPARNLPADVEDVVIDRIVAAFYARGRDPNISRERAEGAGEFAYFPGSSESAVDKRLDPYKLRAI